MANFFVDTFTGTNGTALAAHAPDLGTSWTLENGSSISIRGNRAVFLGGQANSYSTQRTGINYTTADEEVEAKVYVASTSGQLQLLTRVQLLSGNLAFYMFNMDQNGLSVGVRPSGTGGSDIWFANIAKTWTVAQTYTIRLTSIGSTHRVYIDGILVGTYTDANLSGASGNGGGIIMGSAGPDVGFEIDSVTYGAATNPGVTTAVVDSSTQVTASSTAATVGATPYSAQYQRAPDSSGSPGTFANTGSAQTGITTGVAPANYVDTGLTPSTKYWYRVLVTFNDGIVETTAPYTVTTTAGSVLTGGTTSAVSTGTTTTTVSNTAASNGTGPFSYQYQRAPDSSGSPGTYANVGSARGGLSSGVAPSNLSDTGLTANTKYWYRVVVTDSTSTTANSAGVSVTTDATAPRTSKTYYVSAAGNDSNDGLSTLTPWLTVAQVNSFGVVPGDTVLFRGGDTFVGGLLINPASQPGATTRVTINSYGRGVATLTQVGSTHGITVRDTGYVTVKNITVTGPGATLSGTYPTDRTASSTSSGTGIQVETTTATPYRSRVRIDNCIVTGCHVGIQAGSTHATATQTLEHLRISNCSVSACMWAGIVVMGRLNYTGTTRATRYARVINCQVFNIYGITAQPGGTGFGIYFFHCIDSSVERCVAHHLGEAQQLSNHNGTVGVMFVNSTRCVGRFCESYEVYAPMDVDGNGFDFDADCQNCIFEYCYSHDTDGPHFLVWNADGGATSSAGNIVRYCIGVNGGRRNSSNGGCAVASDGDVGTVTVHNCTFWQSFNTGGIAKLLNMVSPGAANFYNNIFSIGGAMNFGSVNTSTLFGNTYEARTGSTFSLQTNSGTYTNLAGLQGANYEKLNGSSVGASGDPVFAAAGTKPIIMPNAQVNTLTAYDTSGASVARSAGVDLQELLTALPEYDFHGNLATGGESDIYSGQDSGATRYGSTPTAGSTAGGPTGGSNNPVTRAFAF